MITNRLHFARGRCRGLDALVRRYRLPFVLSFVLVFSIVGHADGVGAYRGWCRVDPQFQIGGDVVLVTVGAQVGDLKTARALSTGPISIVVRVPPGTYARYLASNNGFGFGFDVDI